MNVGGNAIFGALIALSGPTDFPDSTDLSTPDVLRFALIPFVDPSNDSLASFSSSVTLTPGWYALLYGSGLFGAFGTGVMPFNNTDIGSPSYFRSNNGGPYQIGTFANTRMFLTGEPAEPIPEPGSLMLLGAGLAVAGRALRRRCFHKA